MKSAVRARVACRDVRRTREEHELRPSMLAKMNINGFGHTHVHAMRNIAHSPRVHGHAHTLSGRSDSIYTHTHI